MKHNQKLHDTGSTIARVTKESRAGRFVLRRLATSGLGAQHHQQQPQHQTKIFQRKTRTRVAQWNVRSLTGDGKAEMLISELNRYNISI